MVGRGHVKFYPYKKMYWEGGSLSHAEGGLEHNKFWGSFNMGA